MSVVHCAVWEGWLTDEILLFSIFGWNKTFLSVVLALYYLLEIPSFYKKLSVKAIQAFLPEKLLPQYLYSSLTLKLH